MPFSGPDSTQPIDGSKMFDLILEARDSSRSLEVAVARVEGKVDAVDGKVEALGATVGENRRSSDNKHVSQDEVLSRLEERVRALENWRWLQTGLGGGVGGGVVAAVMAVINRGG